jgi:hypothetical protein
MILFWKKRKPGASLTPGFNTSLETIKKLTFYCVTMTLATIEGWIEQ